MKTKESAWMQLKNQKNRTDLDTPHVSAYHNGGRSKNPYAVALDLTESWEPQIGSSLGEAKLTELYHRVGENVRTSDERECRYLYKNMTLAESIERQKSFYRCDFATEAQADTFIAGRGREPDKTNLL